MLEVMYRGDVYLNRNSNIVASEICESAEHASNNSKALRKYIQMPTVSIQQKRFNY